MALLGCSPTSANEMADVVDINEEMSAEPMAEAAEAAAPDSSEAVTSTDVEAAAEEEDDE